MSMKKSKGGKTPIKGRGGDEGVAGRMDELKGKLGKKMKTLMKDGKKQKARDPILDDDPSSPAPEKVPLSKQATRKKKKVKAAEDESPLEVSRVASPDEKVPRKKK